MAKKMKSASGSASSTGSRGKTEANSKSQLKAKAKAKAQAETSAKSKAKTNSAKSASKVVPSSKQPSAKAAASKTQSPIDKKTSASKSGVGKAASAQRSNPVSASKPATSGKAREKHEDLSPKALGKQVGNDADAAKVAKAATEKSKSASAKSKASAKSSGQASGQSSALGPQSSLAEKQAAHDASSPTLASPIKSSAKGVKDLSVPVKGNGAKDTAAKGRSSIEESASADEAMNEPPSRGVDSASDAGEESDKAVDKKKKKDDLKIDRNGNLEQQWRAIFDKSKGLKPVPYRMSENYEARTVLMHKVLGWGFVLSSVNNRLEVLFKDGIKILIANYKAP